MLFRDIIWNLAGVTKKKCVFFILKNSFIFFLSSNSCKIFQYYIKLLQYFTNFHRKLKKFHFSNELLVKFFWNISSNHFKILQFFIEKIKNLSSSSNYCKISQIFINLLQNFPIILRKHWKFAIFHRFVTIFRYISSNNCKILQFFIIARFYKFSKKN